jgi:UPF0755 protein
MMRLKLGSLVLWLVALAAPLLAVERVLHYQYVKSNAVTETVRIKVPGGASLRTVLNVLAKQELLEWPRALELYLRVHGMRPRIKAGVYDVPAGTSAEQILKLLQSGAVVLERLTVVEGSTFAQFRAALEAHPAINARFRGKPAEAVMTALGEADLAAEGQFFPDTYRFAEQTSDLAVLKMARARLQRELQAAWQQRQEGLPLKTPQEALVLASIVEKETGLASERAQVAGVFITRLRRGMLLQSDPTVIYGLGARYDGNIRSRDLAMDTPYNTYTRAGLPPTPIALPGRASILAVLQPKETGALYFVAKGDGSGSHQFSKTLAEHNRAVRRYLKRLKQNKK